MALHFEIAGQPVPQGSKTATVINGRAVMFDSNKKLKQWRATVTAATRAEMIQRRFIGFEAGDPLVVSLSFYLDRPKTVKRLFPTTKPDLDKLIRAVLDGMTDAKAWPDDSQVVYVLASKHYGQPRVQVSVYNKNITHQDTAQKELLNATQNL
jgi:Holliday junction resolvase RusA-like endonuclease